MSEWRRSDVGGKVLRHGEDWLLRRWSGNVTHNLGRRPHHGGKEGKRGEVGRSGVAQGTRTRRKVVVVDGARSRVAPVGVN